MSKIKLKEIADAIREQEQTTDLIPANQFATRIRNLSGSENLDAELTTQDELLDELEETINSFPDNDALTLTNVDEFELPEVFDGVSTIYHFVLPDGNILFNAAKLGIWLYDIKTKTIEQIYSGNIIITSYQMVKNDCLLTGNGGEIFLYDALNKMVTEIQSGLGYAYAWTNFTIIGDDCLISAQNNPGLLLYESSSKTIRQIYSAVSGWIYTQELKSGLLIVNNRSSSTTILFLDKTTKTITEYVVPEGLWRKFQVVGDDCLIGSDSTSSPGVLLFDSINNSITQVYDQKGDWYNFCMLENDCLIRGTSTPGILLYSASSKVVEKLYDDGTKTWKYFQKVGEDCLIGGSSAGILLYDSSLKTIEKKHTEGSEWKYFQVVGDNCLIGSSSSSGKGVLLYDVSTKTIEQKYTEKYTWSKFTLINDEDCLITGDSSSLGVLLYNNGTKTIELKYSSGAHWTRIHVLENGCLIGSSGSLGGAHSKTLYYSFNNKDIVEISSSFKAEKFYNIDNNTVLLAGINYNVNGIYSFNEQDKTAIKIFPYGWNYSYSTTINDKLFLIGTSIIYDVSNNNIYSSLVIGNTNNSNGKTIPQIYNNYMYNNALIYDIETKKSKYLSNYYSTIEENNNYLYMFEGTKFVVADCRR